MVRSAAKSAFTRVFDALWARVSKHVSAPSFETPPSAAPRDEAALISMCVGRALYYRARLNCDSSSVSDGPSQIT
jgi:hypothetical protein